MKLLDGAYWSRALRSPIVLAGLAVDLAPLYAVIVWGWGAAPLVLLYWLENVISGVMTLPRIVMSGANFGGRGLAAGLFMSVFFVFHYGLFCAVHGTFLMAFLSFSGDTPLANSDAFMDMEAMIQVVLGSGLHVDWMAGLVIAFQVVVFFSEFIFKGEWRRSNPMTEMFSPYARIVVLHFGLFAGAAALVFLGQPMIGVLGLIVFRAIWGVTQNAARNAPASETEQAAARKFMEAMRPSAKID